MKTGMAIMVLKAKVKMHQRWGNVMCLVWDGISKFLLVEVKHLHIYPVGPSSAPVQFREYRLPSAYVA